MNGLTKYAPIVGALVVGILLGYGAMALFGSAGGDRVRNAQVDVGDKAPDFRLPDHTGGFVELGDFRGTSNVVIAFYPLAWTPV